MIDEHLYILIARLRNTEMECENTLVECILAHKKGVLGVGAARKRAHLLIIFTFTFAKLKLKLKCNAGRAGDSTCESYTCTYLSLVSAFQIPALWNKLELSTQTTQSRTGFKKKLTQQIVTQYISEVTCNNPRCPHCRT